MTVFNHKRNVQIAFYTFWIATLFLQAYLVDLGNDEAYYWRFSKQLAWGYFDHPPVTAVLIWLGYFLFENELGVRLLFVVCGALTIGILEKQIKPANLKLFYAIILSIAFLQIGMVFGGGMFAVPDFPLIFFTAVFFHLYKQYLDSPSSIRTVVLLALSISLLLLSKYHGILVVGFAVLAKPALFRRGSFWLLVGLSILFFSPHIYWQVVNDFASIKFHLYERSAQVYAVSRTFNYLASQPFILGPFIGLILLYVGIGVKTKDAYERSMKFVVIGTYIFFFLMTFKGRVEGNWTITTMIPLLLLSYPRIENSDRLKKLVRYSFYASIPLILTLRLFITINFLPGVQKETSKPSAWATELKEKTNGLPAAFMNSYQRASLYEFYTGVPSFSLNNLWGRRNQYTLWDTEAEFQGERIALVANYPNSSFDSLLIHNVYLPYSFVDNFRSYSNVMITSDLSGTVEARVSDTLKLNIQFKYRNNDIRDLEVDTEFPPHLVYSFYHNELDVLTTWTDFIVRNEMIDSTLEFELTIVTPSEPDIYDFAFSIGNGNLPPTINSDKVSFVVE